MKLVVFDLDGTLADTNAVDGHFFTRSLADVFGIDVSSAPWSDYEHVTDAGIVEGIFLQCFGRPPAAAELSEHISHFVQLLQAQHARDRGAFREVPGARTFLAGLRRGDWRASIATGGWERTARFKCGAANLDVDDLPAAFAEDGPSRERIVRAAVARASRAYGQPEFERVVAVGDAPWDVRTAGSLGLPFVGIADADRGRALRSLGVRHVLRDYRDEVLALRCLENADVPRPTSD